ncbi:M13 family metallopeptidase [Natronoflexus pectinivorans]|uniref:Putative endopeptidase n=1 Tax=Natronoflexus pectinivorans TaxID=682526 RepID=A0A4R2G959_9BACT|nr:M13 family metallopeptidase [Natronoflexus pectinivorans]TCO04427.1 putative endopeptidase [Natronoflexus pectinivorans]
MNFKSLVKVKIITLIMLSAFIYSCSNAPQKPALDPANMDITVNPGDDFYRFVNNGWLQNNPLPDDYSRYGAFEQLNEENEQKLYDLLMAIRSDKSAAHGSNRQKIRDFYNSAMDTLLLEEQGISPIRPFLERIDAIDSKEELQTVIAELHQTGIRPLFGMGASQDRKNTDWMIASVGQGGLGMSDRDYYLKDDARSTEIREGYKHFIAQMFSLAGYDDQEAEKAVEAIMQIETSLAESSMDRLTLRNPYATYHIMTLDELSNNSPNINWNNYFDIRNVSIDDLNVAQPEFFKTVSDLMDTVELEKWKTYLKWNVLNSSASFLSSDFDKANFAFYGTVMTGSEVQRERWKRVLGVLNGSLSEAVGQEYVSLYFPPEAKERMIDLVEHLRTAFHQRISNLEWMSDETKEEAYGKLAAMNVKIGYPDKWIDYSDLEIKEQPYILNILAARAFNIKRNLDEIGQPVDRDKWFMSPQTVNAYYSPTMNEIVFPAAILQPPFFYLHADDAMNYGAIGMVIGHEMTHGFDDQGRQFAKDGNLSDWWTEEDSQRFDELSQVLVDQYNNYVMLDSLTINGKLSLGENIADLGGLSIAYQALQNKLEEDGRPGEIDGFTPEQRFFVSYAQVWRNHMREQRLRQQLNEGPHSPGEARVNGIVYNMEEFYKAFNLDESGERFIAPDDRAKIW